MLGPGFGPSTASQDVDLENWGGSHPSDWKRPHLAKATVATDYAKQEQDGDEAVAKWDAFGEQTIMVTQLHLLTLKLPGPAPLN